jgi:hypothetical protein
MTPDTKVEMAIIRFLREAWEAFNDPDSPGVSGPYIPPPPSRHAIQQREIERLTAELEREKKRGDQLWQELENVKLGAPDQNAKRFRYVESHCGMGVGVGEDQHWVYTFELKGKGKRPTLAQAIDLALDPGAIWKGPTA